MPFKSETNTDDWEEGATPMPTTQPNVIVNSVLYQKLLSDSNTLRATRALGFIDLLDESLLESWLKDEKDDR